MRLFKYMSLASLELVLENNTIGFSLPGDLNDPFDYPTVPDVQAYDFFAPLTATLKGMIWASRMGICSLTRTATNSLMWAHYGDKHRGAVIEIDARVAGFLDIDSNAVPAHFGSVIYLNSPDMNQYAGVPNAGPGVTVGQLFAFRLDYYQQLQRQFLSKPLCWAYEEEVRVVKCLHDLDDDLENASGRFSVAKRPDESTMHAYHLPQGSIAGVSFGISANRREVRRIVDDFGLKGCQLGRKLRGSYDIQFDPL